jgi:hypothetical protein
LPAYTQEQTLTACKSSPLLTRNIVFADGWREIALSPVTLPLRKSSTPGIKELASWEASLPQLSAFFI